MDERNITPLAGQFQGNELETLRAPFAAIATLPIAYAFVADSGFHNLQVMEGDHLVRLDSPPTVG